MIILQQGEGSERGPRRRGLPGRRAEGQDAKACTSLLGGCRRVCGSKVKAVKNLNDFIGERSRKSLQFEGFSERTKLHIK